MKIEALDVFNDMPFLFWVKDQDGKYIWGNQTIVNHAGEEIAGKTDDELVWSDNAEIIQASDQIVFESGETKNTQDYAAEFSGGKTRLNVCKWLGDLEGEIVCFGLSFVVD